MYFIDFFKNLFKKSNTGIIIWMSLNLVLICTAFAFLFAELDSNVFLGIVVGLAAYVLSIAIALSPVGEWITRTQNGCKEITDPEILNRLQPLFQEVYARAKSRNPELSNNIKFYLSQDEAPNAFACGRNTVCVTYGLLQYSDDDIRGILGHEFGHLAHKDTDNLQVILVGNLIVSVLFFVIRIFAKVSIWITSFMLHFTVSLVSNSLGATLISWITTAITRLLIDGLLTIAMVLWTKLGVLVCMASSRANEYLADKYSFELGYGPLLQYALQKLPNSKSRTKDVWAALNASHPDTIDRVERLQALSGR